MTDDQIAICCADIEVVRRLAGWQAISLYDAFRVLLDGSGDPDLIPTRVRKLLRRVLLDKGYRERRVIEDWSDVSSRMWVRDPWPIDQHALRDREVYTFRPI